jgi:hypothetical protein
MTLSIIVGGEEMQLGLMELKKEMEQYTHWICASEPPSNGVLQVCQPPSRRPPAGLR